MDVDSEVVELRYQETMEAIDSWVRGQKETGITPDEAYGIGKAFLTQASMAIVSTMPGGDESDSRRLTEGFFEVLLQFADDKIAEIKRRRNG